MKISFFTSTKDRGISLYSFRLLDAMKKDAPDLEVNLVGLENIFRINFNPLRYIYAKRLYTKLGKQMNTGEIAHVQHDYSLFCLWNNPYENMYKTFRKQIHIPLILTVHEVVDRNIQDGGNITTRVKYLLKRAYYKVFSRYMDYIERGMFIDCAAVIVHTQASKEKLQSRGVPMEQIHVIPHGIPKVQKSAESVEYDKEKLGVKDKFVITTFGLISERKGQDLLIDVLDTLPDNVVYVIAGSFVQRKIFIEYYEQLLQKVKDKGLEKRVIFTGFVKDTDVAGVMHATDLILAPSRDITASGSISEAIAYNKVIIATDLPFVQEINQRIPCITTFPKDDKTKLRDTIEILMSDSQMQQQLQAKTQEYALQYDNAYAASQTLSLYRTIL